VGELEADNDEEEGQQSVGRPLFDGQVQMQRLRPERLGAELVVPVVQSRVRDNKRTGGRGEQDEAADLLRA
jgi:hypothetical protein